MSGVIDIVRENFKARQELQGELRSIDEAATADNRPYTEEEQATIAEKRSALEAIDGRITANLEQESRSNTIDDGLQRFLGVIADRESGDMVDTRSIGQRFLADDEVRSWVQAGARGQGGVFGQELDFRAVTDVTGGATSGGALVNPQRLSRVGSTFVDRKTYLVDMLPSVQVSTGSVEYVQDQSPLADLADGATTVAEGTAKPQVGPTMQVVTEPIATIAAWMNITRQVAADAPQLQGYLDSRLRYSLKRRLDAQVINGDGTGSNLTGLQDRAGVTYAPGAAEARYVSIRHTIRLMEDAETVPEIIVLNPADAELFDLSNHAADGLHAVPNVAGPGARTSWGLQQVRSTAIAAGTALLIDPMAAVVLDRQDVAAYMTDSHASNFTSNILTLLLELRAGLALFEPNGVAEVTFNGAA